MSKDTDNPWMQQHLEAERELQDGSTRGDAVVRGEYQMASASFPCTDETPVDPIICKGTAYFKATIGAMKCDTCGALYHCNGKRV